MRRSTILIISILAMLLLAGSLMAFTATIHTDTNYDGTAVITIVDGNDVVWWVSDEFDIDAGSSNTQVSCYLWEENAYIATIVATRVHNGVTITDTDTHEFHYGIANFTLTVNLKSGTPNNPPMQD